MYTPTYNIIVNISCNAIVTCINVGTIENRKKNETVCNVVHIILTQESKQEVIPLQCSVCRGFRRGGVVEEDDYVDGRWHGIQGVR